MGNVLSDNMTSLRPARNGSDPPNNTGSDPPGGSLLGVFLAAGPKLRSRRENVEQAKNEYGLELIFY